MSFQRIRVSDTFSVSTQPALGDISELAAAGVKSRLYDRPGDQEGGQRRTVAARALWYSKAILKGRAWMVDPERSKSGA